MQQTSNTKQRTPSKCREWERQRRNKFNDAINKLGEIVKSINKANSNSEEDSDNIQYPKIEIVQKAIICLTNYVQEKTQLKAEILALEVKLEAVKKCDKKDVSIQVSFVNKKNHNAKHVKILKQQKSKPITKEVPKSSSDIVESKTEKPVIITPTKDKILPKLPKLLPLASNTKKGPENTLVMLPAAPYIFPQRPLLFPTVPPTIVLVDTNLQPINKPSAVPIINRNSTDITKTTMVNILPISAYSRPLSASKAKKNNSRQKNNSKKAKKIKSEDKLDKETLRSNSALDKEASKTGSTEDNNNKQNITENEINSLDSTPNKIDTEMHKNKSVCSENVIADGNHVKTNDKDVENKTKESNEVELKTVASSKPAEKEPIDQPTPLLSPKPFNIENSTDALKLNNPTVAKETLPETKNKDTKLPNILEATICENVDGGNARLELAEELLAASPTAAFLMSFPLVSGNRADSPAEDTQNPSHSNQKDNNLRRNETPQSVPYFEKANALSNKIKPTSKNSNTITTATNKLEEQKFLANNITSKTGDIKTSSAAIVSSASNENPFLNLPMTSLMSTSCSLTDTSFGLEFDCNNVNKTTASQPASYASSANIFYKSDPFNSVKNTIYSTSSISSGHDFNSLGLYPCAMEKYTTKKTDYSNVEDNLMKIGSSRLTYDIDLGWSHKSFDFVNCTTNSNTFSKDSILTPVATTYSSSYNPFNPDFHMPLVTNTNKKDVSGKPMTSFPETISSLYSQTPNLWTEDVPIYNNPNLSKNYGSKQNYHSDLQQPQSQSIVNTKSSVAKHYELKHATDNNSIPNKSLSIAAQPHQMPDTKKSPSKMHINWMTSEIRPMQNNCNQPQADIKNTHKTSHSQVNQMPKKQDHNDSNYFPINMHNYPTQTNQEEFQVWPTVRPAGTTEISIDPPPINLPTLVGDLALGPHDKKKSDMIGQRIPQPDLQNCGSFLSVTQLMNRSTDNMPSRYYGTNSNEPTKSIPNKQSINNNISDISRKAMSSRLETNLQSSYVFQSDPKQAIGNYENMVQFSQSKNKASKSDKSAKIQKNNYSAESLIRGGTCSQKNIDNTSKFMASTQKYNDYVTQDSSVAQVSHFPPIIDYSDNNYTGQQFSGTTLYNSTTNTISNSFYSNFMPGGTNLMAGNYTSGPFPTDFIDYNQAAECNYTNHKYEELKMKNNSTIFQQDKLPSNYKTTRRESAAKHKLECSKKESSKKYQSKRTKLSNDVEEWSDNSHLLWQNKPLVKRNHSNIMSEEIPFPNYVGNQMPTQYQADFFNSHLMSTNMQNMGHHNTDRSITTFPVTSRANFNLSTIFPEITMKVQ